MKKPTLSPDFEAAITGNQTRDADSNKLSESDLANGELKFGLPAALIILLLVFGTVVAGLVPLLMAIVSILSALGLVAVLTQIFELSIFTTNMLVGMGLALGIDYALFVISRYREERGSGREPFAAISASGATASRAVLFSGSAFVVAMFGLLIVPSTIFRSLAAGAILVGITSVLAALTLLPALLGLLRDRVDALRLPYFGRAALRRQTTEGGFWGGVVDRVLRRPWLSARPRDRIARRAGDPGLRNVDRKRRREHVPRQRGVEARATSRCSARSPAPEPTPRTSSSLGASGDVAAATERLRDRLASDPRFGRGEIRIGAGGVTDLVVPVRGDPAGDAATSAVRDLRKHIVPEAYRRNERRPGDRRHIGREHRLLRRGDRPRTDRVRVRARPVARAADRRVPLARRRASRRSPSTCSRSARRTACSCSSSSTAGAPTCSGSRSST